MGTLSFLGTPAQPGIIPRSLDVIFQSIGKKLCSVIRLKPHNGSILRIGAKEAVQEQEFKENIIKMVCELGFDAWLNFSSVLRIYI